MADKKSREVRDCGVRSSWCGEDDCQCGSPGIACRHRPDVTSAYPYDSFDNGIRIGINVDVSEALTGLKAIQREAREATKAMKELEEISKYNESLSEIPTDTLRRELIKRTGVFEYVADNNGLETVLDIYGNGHGYIDKLKDGDTVIVIK